MQSGRRSSIPSAARERVIARYVSTRAKFKAEYRLGGKLVGIRNFDESGERYSELPHRNGKLHGVVRRFESGRLTFDEPYRDGLPHGVAHQWTEDGALLGTYAMNRGTGIDIWRQVLSGRTSVSEIRHLKDGKWHGFEWWLQADRWAVCQERHFSHNQLHGIDRSWNSRGGLRRGYLRYWVEGKRVTKRQYLRARVKDSSLPPFRLSDNQPGRAFLRKLAGEMGGSKAVTG